MITLDSQRVEQALPKVQPGLKKYCWLQENLYKFDVSASREFQKNIMVFTVLEETQYGSPLLCIVRER